MALQKIQKKGLKKFEQTKLYAFDKEEYRKHLNLKENEELEQQIKFLQTYFAQSSNKETTSTVAPENATAYLNPQYIDQMN